MSISCESVVGEMFDSMQVLEFPIYSGQVWSCSNLVEDLGIKFMTYGRKELEGKFEVVMYSIDVKVG